MITPFLVVFVLKPNIIYLRYLLVCIPFILLLLSSLGARLWRCCKWGKLAALILLGLVVYQNGARNYKLMGNGRGNYLKALQFISERDPSPRIFVTGNNRVHIGEVIKFHNRYLDRKVSYLKREKVTRPPRWFIYEVKRFRKRPGPNQGLTVPTEWGKYHLVRRFHYSSLSGAHWYILQHESFR